MCSQFTPDQFAARFWSRVDKRGDCWTWTGYIGTTGYGYVRHSGPPEVTHRVAWLLTFGDIPEHLYVCHHCDYRPCVRPDHLFLGTAADNYHDMVTKGRRRNGPRQSGANHWTARRPDDVPRGEAQGRAVLTEADVIAIRAIYKSHSPVYGAVALARLYGVTRDTIHDVIARRTWQHVA